MVGRLSLLLAATAACLASVCCAEDSTHTLPAFFFHGVTANAKIAANLQQNLSTDARPFIPLTFCQDLCSIQDFRVQTKLAIAQIRNITTSDSRFDRGYVFVGHSQGGAIARAVIEEMDDHKVHTLISVAGAQNGQFYGPQSSDLVAAQFFLKVFAPVLSDPKVVNYSRYSLDDVTSGKLQVDVVKVDIAHPEYQDNNSGAQLTRSPYKSAWLQYNKVLPALNNLVDASDEQARRKRNFLKLQAAYFFGSPQDDTISPWQTAILGQYSDVDSLEDLEKNFRNLKIIPMTETDEYKQDTYGLKTLDKRGGLFLRPVDNVSHRCWLLDAVPFGGTEECKFRPVFEKTLYPLLSPETPTTTKPPNSGCPSSD